MIFTPHHGSKSKADNFTFLLILLQEQKICESIVAAGFQATIMKENISEGKNQVCLVHIKGMTCITCVDAIETSLLAVNGVKKAQVALATEEALIQFDPDLVSYNELLEAVEDSGFEAVLVSTGEDRSEVQLKVDGLDSEHSLDLVKSSLEALPGVQILGTDLELQKISLCYKSGIIGPRKFIEVIESIESENFKAMIYPAGKGRGSHKQEQIKQYYRSFLWSLVFMIPVFLTSMIFDHIPGIKHVLNTKVVKMMNVGEIIRWVLATPLQFIIGWRFYTGAYNALSHGAPNMDVLITLGTNAAYFYSAYTVIRAATSRTFEGKDFFETSCMLISFVLLGKYLEALARGKTSEAIAKLMDLAPEKATLLSFDLDGSIVNEEDIDSRLIHKNDVLKVIPGAKIACDGSVIWGQSYADESMITGESRPVSKKKGDLVIGGTVNQNGVLHIKATRVGSESALSQIVRLVESAQMAKAPVQKLSDRISRYFVPLVSTSIYNMTHFLLLENQAGNSC